MKSARKFVNPQMCLGFAGLVSVLVGCSAEPNPAAMRGVTPPAAAGTGSANPPPAAAGGGGPGGGPTAARGGLIAGSSAPGTAGTAAAGTSGAAPSLPDGLCEVVRLAAQQQTPDVMIVLDRSGSMEDSGRWAPSVNAVRKVTSELEGKINFGLTLFPDPTPTGGGSWLDCISAPDPDMCLQSSSGTCAAGKVVVPIGMSQAAMIGKVLNTATSQGGTPTSDTLAGLVDTFATSGGPDAVDSVKFVLLVTDGLPTCPAGNGMDTTQPDIDAANAAIEALAAKDVRTYVVGYDTAGPENAMLASVLDGFAQRGGTGDTMHRPVEDETSLLTELQSITSAVASCSFELDAAPPRPDFVLVKLDGTQVNMDDPNGWRLVGDKTIELTGQSCDTFKSGGTHSVDAQVQCDVVTPA